MNQYHTNVYERVTDIMYLLYEADGISVSEISAKYKVDYHIVLEDLRYLSEAQELEFLIFPCDERFDTDEFLEELFAGKHNEVKLYAEKADDGYMVSLQLSAFEKIFLNHFLKEYPWKEELGRVHDILIKNGPADTSWAVLQVMGQINEAIGSHEAVRIRYDSREMDMVPIKMVKMVSTGTCYCMALELDEGLGPGELMEASGRIRYVRLDRVEHVEGLCQGPYLLTGDWLKQELGMLDYRWGMEDDQGPFPFAMIVYDEANLPRRLYGQLKNRRYGTWKRNADHTYLYEDMVMDYESLKQWVMELGSSVKVIEPRRLRDEILEAAYSRLDIYGKGSGDGGTAE